MRRIIYNILVLLLLPLLISACGSKTYQNVDYLQNVVPSVDFQISEASGLIIEPKDHLSIIVSSSDPELSYVFNLAVKAFQAGSPSEVYSVSNERLLGYHVNEEGNIDFPVLGSVHVAGLTRTELEAFLQDELSDNGYLTNPHVIVEFLNFKVSVIGEVKKPGIYTIPNDKVNVLQVLSMAGDMTIYGVRQDVKVIRELKGQRQIFSLDLTSRDVFNSPGYYLQQNDIVYVVPNNVRAGQSTINENYIRSGGFIISLSSIALVLANFLIKVL